MSVSDIEEMLSELVQEVKKRGDLPPVDPGSFDTNRTWARRYRMFPRLLRADINGPNGAWDIWKAEGLESQMIPLPQD